ncbi:tRNA (adenosine(37)-N6)-dimethylallyltransferase MiaA [Candidatus Ichthyocystis hellenicum]|uniref:tRNA (adenosine(37)-N6)-dimethylallyltransferase MiaA n=1 Tax=Candidatus Ichthyocystis hellenicum TaxID=1561003 RepID=UPI000AF76C96|nr:tRNA (adenosine(37)-N6)-dimethylallyltransferase MiaA [Candidatus Ichthyocystis hellenicum]
MNVVVAIVGPTAIGKTKLAFSLAKEWPIEVISMDSAQVYRNMNIGTAKPSLEERQELTHHLVDIIDPTEFFSVSQFISLTKELIPTIWARGKIPVLVGGTFLYLHGIYQGISSMPERSPLIRKKIEEEAEENGWPSLHQKLAIIDPDRAAIINKNDRQRIQRALEIYYVTGKKMSECFTNKHRPFSKTPFWICGLNVNERQSIHEMISIRFKNMIKMGLIEEVKQLATMYKLHEDTAPMKCVGYRQVMHYLMKNQSMEELIARGTAATRQLAKRQLTWIKKTPCNTVLWPYDDPDAGKKLNQELGRYMLLRNR